MRRLLCLTAAALAAAVLSTSAAAAPLVLDSDAAFNAWSAENGFTKSFGGNVRWGNGAADGDWEYAVVDAADTPFDQEQMDWGPGPNIHTTIFSFNAITGDVSLDLTGTGSSDANFLGAKANTLFLRAAANPGQTAAMTGNMVVEFADLTSISLDNLFGDADGQWIGIIDPRLKHGFSALTALAMLDAGPEGRGSRPMYQFKVGYTPIPEPASLLLLGAGLAGLGLARRRRA